MTALFLTSQTYTINAASQSTTAPATNLAVDPPGMTWRSADLNAPYVIIQTNGQPIDTIALIGCNTNGTDQLRVRGASASSMANPIFDRTIPAWTGTAPYQGATTILSLETTSTPAYIRIDFTSTASAGYVEVQRLLVGKRIVPAGISIGAEDGENDGSTMEEALGSTIIDPQRTRSTYKLSLVNMARADYLSTWRPFLKTVGNKVAFLYVPDTDPGYLNAQHCFGRISTSAKSTWDSYDRITIELNITQV